MARKSEASTDLFGDPYEPLRDRRGRKSLRFGDEAHEKVRVLAAMGMDQDEIAAAMEVSEPTLRKYFFRDLKVGVAKTKAAVVLSIFKGAVSGKTGSQRIALGLLDIAAAAQQMPASPPPRADRLGKKEERRAAADRIGGIYEPGAPPARPH